MTESLALQGGDGKSFKRQTFLSSAPKGGVWPAVLTRVAPWPRPEGPVKAGRGRLWAAL